ncbi:MAG: transglycosylase SLT domain-containing protein [Gemmatimonadota bacterium]
MGAPTPSIASKPVRADSNLVVAAQPTIVPAPPLPDHSVIGDSALLRRLAADSAADAAMLEKLHETTVAATDPTASLESAAAELGPTFDINVASYAEHSRVRYYLDFFQGSARDRMAIWLNRLPRYEPMIRAAMLANGLPGDLVYLGLIESGYSNTAVSRSRAVGMWQFMKGTGKEYGLRIDGWVDERRDPLRATNAAARYLARLTDQFGSHYLAAAAYNGGPGTIRRGLRRIGGTSDDAASDDEAADEPSADDSFFQLSDTRYLRRETKDYVPKLIAAAMIAKKPEKYGFEPVHPADPFQVDSIEVLDATSLEVVAKVGNLSLADLLDLNAHFLHAVTPPGERVFVRVPPGRGESLAPLLRDLPAAERLPAFTYIVRRRETFRSVASRFGLTLKDLSALNPKVKAAKVGTGTTLVIPGAAQLKLFAAEDRRVASDHRGSVRRIHIVKRGETLSAVSRRYGVSVGQLSAWNGLAESARLHTGQRLTIGMKRGHATARRSPQAKKRSLRSRSRAG